jgi:hypothetical protein
MCQEDVASGKPDRELKVAALVVVFGYAYSGRFLYTPLSSKEMAVQDRLRDSALPVR